MSLSDRIRLALQYAQYRWQCTHVQVLHSPFVYKLYTDCITQKQVLPAFQAIEERRRQLLAMREILQYPDLGAGSQKDSPTQRTVAQLARYSLKPARQARLLYQLVRFFKPGSILELGTSLGTSSAYMALALQELGAGGKLYSMEGAAPVAALARETFRQLQLGKHIELMEGNFDELLPSWLDQQKTVDLVFIDGNHRYEPTLRYFERCLTKAHNNSVFVFDDIYWSAEMQDAWKKIISHPEVTVSIDLFHLGLVFFRKEQATEHFRLHFA